MIISGLVDLGTATKAERAGGVLIKAELRETVSCDVTAMNAG